LQEDVMAVIFILVGGIFGFFSAIASLILLDASLPVALAIWSGSGFALSVLGLAPSFLTGRTAGNLSRKLRADAQSV
ncbi:MAG: hypothetical protein ACK4GC_06210, partial [Paracoccaceae bacterium]